jgi:hypothetical protein
MLDWHLEPPCEEEINEEEYSLFLDDLADEVYEYKQMCAERDFEKNLP